MEGGPQSGACHRGRRHTGLCRSLITPLGAVELVVALKTPKSGFRALSEVFTRQGLRYSVNTGLHMSP